MTRKHSPYRDRDVVEVYDRLAVPIQFAAPARDLVQHVKLVSGERVLDVGTGTGVVLTWASTAVGGAGLSVGIDSSIEMLQANHGDSCLVSAQAPELPFLNETFDAVLSSFVITHFDRYEAALREMVRVMRPGGRLGVTAWGPGTNPFADLWNEVVSQFMSLDELKQAFKSMIPWSEWFSQEANLSQALTDAGLSDVRLHRHDYLVSVSTNDYLLLRELSLRGHVVKGRIGTERWAEFRRDVSAAFQLRFGAQIQYSEDVLVAVGTKALAINGAPEQRPESARSSPAGASRT